MTITTTASYPGGSKARVNKAGDAVRRGVATSDDLTCIDIWRAAHAPVLNTFQALLRGRARNQEVVVGQRHKRKLTIFGKLRRFPKMELARMDDIAGCRLIFNDVTKLHSFRNSLHEARFRHKKRNENDNYNYILRPKGTGYRGIHDIYEYDVKSQQCRELKGLFVELQYRTRVQHAWATAVEMIGLLTNSQPKFQEGDKSYEEMMGYASEILARAYENSTSCHPDCSNQEVVRNFLDYDTKTGLLPLLRGLNSSAEPVTGLKNAILILKEGRPLEVRAFRYSPDALKALFEIEASQPGTDVVLVKGESADDIRIAFRNYFTDAQDFIKLVEDGCEKLSGTRVLVAAPKKSTKFRTKDGARGLSSPKQE